MAYIGKSPDGTGVRSRFYYTQTSGGGTSISGSSDDGTSLAFSDGAYVDVFLNGVLLVAGTDYNTSTANTISGLAALANGDVVEVVVYDIFTVADTVSASQGGTFNASVTIADDLTVDTNTLHVDSTNNRLGVGTVSPSSTLNVSSGAANTNTTFESSDATVLNRYKDSGGSAQISSTSGDLKIATGGDTSFSGLANNLVVTSGGNVGIGTSSGSARLTVSGAGTGAAIDWENTTSGVGRTYRWVSLNTGGFAIEDITASAERLRIGSNGHLYATCNDGSLANLTLRNGASGDAPDFLQCRDSANNLEMKVEPDGDVYNANGTYGTLSDQKLKENITDASSQWDDIKALRLRKYNLIGNENFHIGVVAQELEAAGMSGLVSESVDFDEDGNDLGTTTKSVKYSILHTKALKALQEAMERIEALETKVAALEAAE